jgi:hypothetical protein
MRPGKIEFGVINQSSSAFNHILNDVSLVVYQVSHTTCAASTVPAAAPRAATQASCSAAGYAQGVDAVHPMR